MNRDIVGGSGQTITLLASDTTRLVNGAGGLGGSTGNVGIGAGIVVGVITKDTRAYIGWGADVAAGGSISITSTSVEDLLNIAASIGASNSVGVSASIIVGVITVGSRAYISSNSGAPSSVLAGGDLTIAASDDAKIGFYAGGLAVGSSAGVGVSSATQVRNSTVLAFVGTEDDGNRKPTNH